MGSRAAHVDDPLHPRAWGGEKGGAQIPRAFVVHIDDLFSPRRRFVGVVVDARVVDQDVYIFDVGGEGRDGGAGADV